MPEATNELILALTSNITNLRMQLDDMGGQIDKLSAMLQALKVNEVRRQAVIRLVPDERDGAPVS